VIGSFVLGLRRPGSSGGFACWLFRRWLGVFDGGVSAWPVSDELMQAVNKYGFFVF
jgi:hypothetical protein